MYHRVILFMFFQDEMSDGNFNRQLLPKTEISSGLRAGKAQMRAKAEKAITAFINEEFTDLSDEQKKQKVDKFMDMLRN